MDIKEILFSLSNAVNIGNVNEAADIAFDMLSKYTKAEKLDKSTVVGFIKGESDYTLMLDAHLDEVGFVVTNIDDNGFLTVVTVGGIDLRTLPASVVYVHGKEKIPAVFVSTPPHLAKEEKEYKDISEIKLDSCLGSSAKDIISVGDYVSFSAKASELQNSCVMGKSFDDRAGVTCLIELARRLSGKKLPFNVCFCLCNLEELGLRGTTTATFKISPDEAVAIDVSFGDAPDVSSDESGVLGDGAMIGISPVLCREISDKLLKVAKQKKIPYQLEIMGGKTGTDGDAIAVSKRGVKTGLVSIPLRNMHTSAEVLDIKDIESVCDILEEYILSGGILND